MNEFLGGLALVLMVATAVSWAYLGIETVLEYRKYHQAVERLGSEPLYVDGPAIGYRFHENPTNGMRNVAVGTAPPCNVDQGDLIPLVHSDPIPAFIGTVPSGPNPDDL